MTYRSAIILTVAYSAQFSYPLQVSELWLRLLTRQNAAFSKAVFVAELLWLVERGRLEYQAGYVFLPGRVTDIQLRLTSEQRAQQKREQLDEVVTLCRFIPWITGVAVTGSVAMRQARNNDDLDFLLITMPQTLWISRAILVFLSLLLGKYRSRKNAHTSGWCFNMWLESHDLSLPSEKHSVYTAFEVLQADWIFDRGNTKQLFLLANAWVGRVIPNAYRNVLSLTQYSDRNSFAPSPVVFNAGAYALQRWYMRSAMTRELVSYSSAYFHPRDTHTSITARWRELLQALA
ncbi:MAG: hypothetical protein GW947_03290 [Candidatus Pacebacteria bacterium]|nr:hypothetical protein [Candidatus Paceibacterota bacterium]PIR61277.1 MAG: hypothetical protein COU68_00265 [Candidatus Pacebacteria bacterium CG10_big_fil_rev_8_21_14_0_10_45_6]